MPGVARGLVSVKYEALWGTMGGGAAAAAVRPAARGGREARENATFKSMTELAVSYGQATLLADRLRAMEVGP